ncbi:tetratricopeptide repeat protein [bacterium]|nr:tetratricopeptide repeat protein [bacterium]
MSWYLPVVFFLGILLGAVGLWGILSLLRSNQTEEACESHLGRAVLALVRKDTETAVQNLVYMLNKNTDNIDAYMALSNLYRENGWFNRAIDIRRRLLSRSILRPEQRRSIMLEMVNDFEHAGLLDRAVSAMAAILDATDPTQLDYEMLARLQENAGNMQLAFDYWKKAANPVNQAFVRVEQARKHISQKDFKTARKFLGQALKLHRKNPAALLLLAELTARNGKIQHAEKLLNQLQNVRPDLTGVIADTLEQITLETGDAKLIAFFTSLMEEQKKKPRVAVRYAGWLMRHNRCEEAINLIESVETSDLAPEMMIKLVETAAACNAHEITAKLGLEAMHRFVDKKPYVCHGCKELIPELLWKCPRCGQWGTLRSRTTYSVE